MPSKAFSKRIFHFLLALGILLFFLDLWLGFRHQVHLQVLSPPPAVAKQPTEDGPVLASSARERTDSSFGEGEAAAPGAAVSHE